MNPLEIALPGSILVLAFVLKLFVDRTATVPDLIAALFELPIDVAFLAIALVAAFTISEPSRAAEGLISFIIYVVGAVLVVFLGRRSHSLFFADRHWPMVGLTSVGYGLSGYALVHAVGLVSGIAQ